MSTPLLFILAPILLGLGLGVIHQRRSLVILLGTLFSLGLAAIAWLAPLGKVIQIGPLSISLTSSLSLFGREFILDSGDKTFLVMLYVLAAFWFAGYGATEGHWLFVPLGLVVTGILAAAQAVEPFLYAGLLVETAVLLCIPLLAPPGKRPARGVVYYLIYQTLALPFILLAGWALSGVEADPANTRYATLAVGFLGLGFSFWLAVFPFNTWVVLLAEQCRPYVTGWVLVLLPTSSLLLGLKYLNEFAWLRTSPQVYTALAQVGVVMVFVAGASAIFQNHLGRLLGYGVIIETGFSLIAVGLHTPISYELFTGMFFARVAAVGAWSLSASVLLDHLGSLELTALAGVARRFPILTTGLITAFFTLAGLPLLGGFAPRLALLLNLSESAPGLTASAVMGSLAYIFAGLRLVSTLLGGTFKGWRVQETWREGALIAAGVVILWLVGLLPQYFLTILHGLMSGFGNLLGG